MKLEAARTVVSLVSLLWVLDQNAQSLPLFSRLPFSGDGLTARLFSPCNLPGSSVSQAAFLSAACWPHLCASLPVTPIALGTNLASTALSPVQRGGPLPRGWPVCRSGPEAHQAQGLCQGPPQHFHAPSWLEHSHPLEVEVTPFTDEKVNLGVLRTHSQHSWKAQRHYRKPRSVDS